MLDAILSFLGTLWRYHAAFGVLLLVFAVATWRPGRTLRPDTYRKRWAQGCAFIVALWLFGLALLAHLKILWNWP